MMRQFELLCLYGSAWVSALHIPADVGHWSLYGASTLWYVKWHKSYHKASCPLTTSSHLRLPQPKFQSRRNLLVSFVVTANALTVWHWHRGKEVCLSRGRYSRYHAGICILSWRRSWDCGVQETRQVCHVVRVEHVSADFFGNSGPSQRIGCAVPKRFGPQNHFCLCRWQGRTIYLPTILFSIAL